MAENNLTTLITANADFSSLRTQLAAVTAQLVKLQETTVGTNAKLGNQIAVMNKAFSETLRSTGQFSTHFVSLSSDVEKFGKQLDRGQLKLNQYYKAWQNHSKNTGSLIKDLAKQQVMLEQAIVQPLGKNAQGLMQYNVQVAKGLDLIKNKTAVARQEAAILNKVMMDGSNQLINWGKNTQWAGRQLTVGLTVPLAAFGAAAQKAFRDADAELVRLQKVYGGLGQTSATELAKVRKDVSNTARELAASYGVAYKDTISLAADLAATGKEGNDLLKSTQQTTRLAVLGEIDRQDAMKATLAIQNAFKQNTDELTQSIDFLNAVENQTSTSLADLVEAIPKAGPVVKSLGGDVKDLALYLTAMKEGGVNASEGANAIKSAMASLINPTKVATEMFNGLGIDLQGIVTKNAGNLTETILALQASLDKLDPLSKSKAIEQLFGKFQFARMSALFENLNKQGSQTIKVLDLMKASSQDLANISARELSQMTESASGRYKRALAAVQADLAQVGQQFLKISTAVLNVVDGILKFFEKLPAPVKSALNFLGGLTAVAGPLIMLTGVLGNFVGYVIKGVFHLKSLIKGGQGFKLLTPEIIAAMEAGKGLQSTFYNDAEATNVLRAAVDTLTQSFNNLELKANAAKVAVNPAITTVANSVILAGKEGQRVVDKNNPLVGKPYSRQMSHLVPAGTEQPGTIFGTVPGPGPVNVRIGKNPQAYMAGDMQKIPGVTSINGTSTGIVASEAAKWHSMMGALAMQSEQEIKILKQEVAATGTVTAGLSQSYQALLPEITKVTELAASETSAIVSELQAGKITADAARAKIIQLNVQIEQMIAQTSADVAATMGRTVNLTQVPLTGQPVVGANGKSNMKELFHKGNIKNLVDKIARSLGGVRTSGAGYSIQTTKPTQNLNSGGRVYDPAQDGPVVPGPKNINYDIIPAQLATGGYILNQKASQDNPALVGMAKPYNRGGKVNAMLTPGETYFGPEQTSRMLPLLENANRGNKITFQNAGGILGGLVRRGKRNYGVPVDSATMLTDYVNYHTRDNFFDLAKTSTIAADATALASLGVPPENALREADAWFKARYTQTLAQNDGVFSQNIFDRVTTDSYSELDAHLKTKYKGKLNLRKGESIFKATKSGSGKMTLKRSDWEYLNVHIDPAKKKVLRNQILALMSRKYDRALVNELKGYTKLTGTGPNQGAHRAHFRPGAVSPIAGVDHLGRAMLQPWYINSFAQELSRYGIYPNSFSLDPVENRATFDSAARKLGYQDSSDMIHKVTNKITSKSNPSQGAMRTENGLTTKLRKMLELKPDDFSKWMSSSEKAMAIFAGRRSPAVILRNGGGLIGGRVTSNKHNYGIMNSNAFIAKNPHLFKQYKPTSKGIQIPNIGLISPERFRQIMSRNPGSSSLPWIFGGVSPEMEAAAARMFAQYPNGQMPTAGLRQKEFKFPQPKPYYQDIANDDPAHGTLHIGSYRGETAVRNQYVAPRIGYRGTGYMQQDTVPAFEIGNLESRAKSSLFKYMQGDYSSINDPAVQQYLSTIRTKFTGTLHRGVRNTASLPPVIRELISAGKWDQLVGKEFIMRRSSWSTNKDTAEGFGQLQLVANVKNRNAVPASEIFPDLTFHSPAGPVKVNENEVYMGGRFKVVKASKNKLVLQAVYDAARENGGPVNAGRPYLVGEKGPEIFVPKKSGGIIPGYNKGGMFKSMLMSMAGMTAGQTLGGMTGLPGGSMIGAMLGSMLGMGGGGTNVGENQAKRLPFFNNATGQKAFATIKPLSETAARLTNMGTAGSKAGAVMSKLGPIFGRLVASVTPAGLAIGAVTTAVTAGIIAWKKHQEFVRINAVGYGLTAKAAEKAGLKYKDYNSVIKDALQNAKDMAARNKLVYESLQDSGTPLNLTIEQYKKLKTEVKSVYADQVKAINQADGPDAAIALAMRLKEQLVAGGMAADEATKKIFAMFQMSNKANLSIAATTGNKAFNRITDAKTASIFAVRDYGTATKTQREGSAQAAQFNTAMSAVEAGIQQRISDSEKASRKDGGKTKVLTYLEAERQQLDYINQASGTQATITQKTIKELSKANPQIAKMVTTSDTLTSVWGKLRLLAAGFAGDLSLLNAKQVKALQQIKDTIETNVIATNKKGLLKDQYSNLEKLTAQQKALAAAAKGQSVQQQINARDAIAALQKQIDANNKLTDARLKALDAAKQEADLGNEIAKKKAEYDAAVATGNTAGAQVASLDIAGLQKQMQYNAQRKSIEDANTLKNAPLLAQIEALNNKQQKLSDNAALAGDSLGKVTTKLNDQKTKIDNVNAAMVTLELNAKASGKSLADYANGAGKGQAAQILAALKAAGATMPATTRTELTANGPVTTKISVGDQAVAALKSFGLDKSIDSSLTALGGGKTLKDIWDALKGNKNMSGGYTPGKDGTGIGNDAVTVTAKTIKEAAQKAITDKQSKQFITDQNPVGYYLFKWKDGNYAVDKQTNQVYKFDAVKNKLGAKVTAAAGGKMGVMPGDSFLVGENGPELFHAKSAGNIIPANILRSLQAASPSYQIPTNGLSVAGGTQSGNGSVINLTQNIYPSEGMNTDAFVRQVVSMTKQAIGQDAKINAKMVGSNKNVSIKS